MSPRFRIVFAVAAPSGTPEDKDMHCDRQSGINEQQGKALLARAKRGGRVTVTTG